LEARKWQKSENDGSFVAAGLTDFLDLDDSVNRYMIWLRFLPPCNQWFRIKFSAARASSSEDTSSITRSCSIKYQLEERCGVDLQYHRWAAGTEYCRNENCCHLLVLVHNSDGVISILFQLQLRSNLGLPDLSLGIDATPDLVRPSPAP